MNLVDMLKAEEGFRPLVYDDATGETLRPGYTLKGNATIGYGWACSINSMSNAEAELILRARAEIAEGNAAALLGVPAWGRLGPVRQAALAAMVYQMGAGGVRSFGNLLASLRTGNWDRAQMDALDSHWARQTPARAQRVAGMFATGKWPELVV